MSELGDLLSDMQRFVGSSPLENLQDLHVVLFGNPGNERYVKRNLCSFKRLRFSKNDSAYNRRLLAILRGVTEDGLQYIAKAFDVQVEQTQSTANAILDHFESFKIIATDDKCDQVQQSGRERLSVASKMSTRNDTPNKALELRRKVNALENELLDEEEALVTLEQELAQHRRAKDITDEELEEKSQDLSFKVKFFNLKKKRVEGDIKLLEDELKSGNTVSAVVSDDEEHDILDFDTSGNHSLEGLRSASMRNACENEFLKGNAAENNTADAQIQKLSRDMQCMFARQSAGNTLGSFDGSSCLQWPGFLSQFNLSTVTCGFSPAENVLRLNSSLKGEAKAKVEMLLVTAKDPQEILEILNAIYGKPSLIARALEQKAEGLTCVQSLQDFEEFSYQVRNIAAAVTNIEPEDVNQKQLLGTLISKLPSHLTTQWGSYLIENNLECRKMSIQEFSKWTYKMAQVISNITFKPEYSSAQSKRARGSSQEVAKEASIRCKACNGSYHSFDTCPNFKKADPKQRWEMASKFKICFCCLNKHMGKCPNRQICGINNCPKTHHRLLHKTPASTSTEVSMNTSSGCGVLLKLVTVILRGPKGEVETVAFLDGGSTATLLDASLADALGVQGPIEPLCCRWTGDMYRYDETSQTVNVEVEGVSNKKRFKLKNVRTVKDLRLPEQQWDVEALKKKYPYIIQGDLAALESGKPMILIGENNADAIVTRQVIQPQQDSPILSRTVLGWTIHGPTGGTAGQLKENVFACCDHSDDVLHAEVKRYFTVENFGVSTTSKHKSLSMEDALAERIAESTIKYNNKRYEIGYPWKSEEETMVGGSKQMALQRLKCLEKKLLKLQDRGTGYCTEIEKIVEKGYAKKISSAELVGKTRIWFLPHFAVFNPKKPGKVRVVFDAAAKVNGKSLNDYILTGPDWLTSLFGILLRFRQYSVAFSADICEMFNRVEIREEDTYAQCFLWRNLKTNDAPQVFRMKAMFFGSVAAPFLAQYVKNYNAKRFSNEFPMAVEAIVKNHYVDDYLHGADNDEEALKIINEVRFIHGEGGFELKKFISNSKEVLRNIPRELLSDTSVAEVDVKQKSEHRVLGMLWKSDQDCLTFAVEFSQMDSRLATGEKIPTKRQVLRMVMSVFDPIGLISPVTILGRILLQTIWRSGIGWDDFISVKMFEEWKKWLAEVQKINSISLPRIYSTEIKTAKSVQLHTFCDASEDAYCAVAYLRIEDRKGRIGTSLVASKARVAPIRSQTIPKLELMAAVLGARLSKTITDELDITMQKRYFWSDSKTVLQWLHSEKRLQSFASARVGEILELTEIDEWGWVPTNHNIADDCTRNSLTNFNNNHRWFIGPNVIKSHYDNWPKLEHLTVETVDLLISSEPLQIEMPLPRIKYYYSWIRILRTTARLKRFLDNSLAKFRHGTKNLGTLTVLELEWAERKWWMKVQRESFATDLHNTINNQKNTNGRLSKENLQIDDNGILRILGRFRSDSIISFDMSNPVCLCATHPYVKAMIKHYHIKYGHQGMDTIINELRKKFHIPRVRTEVKRVVNCCLFCRKLKCKPEQPIMGNLPNDRLRFHEKPFTVTGVDYFGPIEVKVGRKIAKRYGVLFSCLTSRAIHVEIAHSLTTDSCIMAIRRFVSRRGHVKKFWSDNGSNFKGANRELRRALADVDEEKLQNSMVNSGIDWQFIPQGAPHMGGSWERLIKCFKRTLCGILKEKRPTDEVLATIFSEAEYIVNSRPLTYPSTETDDLRSLTANDLLVMNSCPVSSPGVFTETDNVLRKQWRYSQYLADLFWKRWLVEYVPSLVRRQKWKTGSSNLKEGELVLVGDKNLPRLTWPIGIIQKTYCGEDGVVRVADVKTAKGEYRRPATKLHRLEIDTDCTDNRESVPGGTNVENDT